MNITIKELAEKIQAVEPKNKMSACRDTAKTYQRLIWYAGQIKKIGGNIKKEEDYLIFQHAGGGGKIYVDSLTEKILLPYLT